MPTLFRLQFENTTIPKYRPSSLSYAFVRVWMACDQYTGENWTSDGTDIVLHTGSDDGGETTTVRAPLSIMFHLSLATPRPL